MGRRSTPAFGQGKKKLDQQRQYAARSTPGALIAELRQKGAAGDLYAPDEEYLNAAVSDLLPRYYAAPPDREAGELLRVLSNRMIQRHGDQWLADALKTPHTARAGEAFAALGRAAEADRAWDWAVEEKEARMALQLFEPDMTGRLHATLYLSLGLDWANRAKECIASAESLKKSAGEHEYSWLHIQAMLQGSICAKESGDLEAADAGERGALEEANQKHYSVLAMRAVGIRAARYASIGNEAGAWRENLAGLDDYWNRNYPAMRAYQFYSALSLLSQQYRNSYSAAAWARELQSIAAKSGRADLKSVALWQLGMAELASGKRDQAYADLAQSRQVSASIGGAVRPSIDLARLEAHQGNLEKAETRLSSVRPAAELSGGLERLQFEVELGQVYLRGKNYAAASKLFQEAQYIADRSWLHASAADRPLWARTLRDIYRGLVECEIRTDPGTARKLWQQYRSHLLDVRRTPSSAREPPVALPLPAATARLSFVELSSGLGVWLETNQGSWFREIPSAGTVRDAADRLARNCATEQAPLEVVRENAQDLSQALLGPWDVQLNEIHALAIEPDDPAGEIPWQALVRINGHYWSDDFAIRVLNGTAPGGVTPAPLTDVRQALVVGAPAIVTADYLPPLPHARDEAEKVSALFGRSTLLTGQSATLSTVQAELRQVELFHFVGHGYGGDGGGLVLRGANGGLALLRSADIETLDLSRCRVVVLAGCSTAAGERGGPGNPQSLVRSFLRAGSRQVVAGLWNLDSAGTEILMREFYSAMLAGAPAADALRQAGAKVREDHQYAHPYFWAGLEVFSRD